VYTGAVGIKHAVGKTGGKGHFMRFKDVELVLVKKNLMLVTYTHIYINRNTDLMVSVKVVDQRLRSFY